MRPFFVPGFNLHLRVVSAEKIRVLVLLVQELLPIQGRASRPPRSPPVPPPAGRGHEAVTLSGFRVGRFALESSRCRKKESLTVSAEKAAVGGESPALFAHSA